MGAGGRWVEAPQANGTVRRDWRPDEQPPSPDGTPGSWHVVSGDGQADRWEWIPAAGLSGPPQFLPPPAPGKGAKAPSSPGSARPAIPSALRSPKALVAVAAVAGLVAAGLVVPRLLGSGSGGAGPADPAVVAELTRIEGDAVSREVAASFSAFQVGTDANGQSVALVQATFTNNGSSQQNFQALVEAVDAGTGASLGEDTALVLRLAPGQSTTVPMFQNLPGDRWQAMGTATFAVKSFTKTQAPL
ncbi:MAG: hypothetical protein ACT4QG_01390 [Sporichthyaceae bacterium]